jgi:hypothetical protein
MWNATLFGLLGPEDDGTVLILNVSNSLPV